MVDRNTTWSRIALGFGGNLGDPAATIHTAAAALNDQDIARIDALSPVYRTPPWGPVAQPDFANACAIGSTRLAPNDLLRAIKVLEQRLGRAAGVRWGPRAVDIDILWFEGQDLSSPDLVLPHPGLFERAFVLVPLADIAPDLEIAGRRVGDAARAIDTTSIRCWTG